MYLYYHFIDTSFLISIQKGATISGSVGRSEVWMEDCSIDETETRQIEELTG